jgi:hypothetical protein
VNCKAHRILLEDLCKALDRLNDPAYAALCDPAAKEYLALLGDD